MADDAVFAVTSGAYSDYHVDGLFSTRELAEQFVAAFDQRDRWDAMSIEEWVLDPRADDLIAGRKGFFVRINPQTGDVSEVSWADSSYGFRSSDGRGHGVDINGNWFYHVFADDHDHAKKVANERRLIERAELPTNSGR